MYSVEWNAYTSQKLKTDEIKGFLIYLRLPLQMFVNQIKCCVSFKPRTSASNLENISDKQNILWKTFFAGLQSLLLIVNMMIKTGEIRNNRLGRSSSDQTIAEQTTDIESWQLCG